MFRIVKTHTLLTALLSEFFRQFFVPACHPDIILLN